MSRGKLALANVLIVLGVPGVTAIFATGALADPSHNIQAPQQLTCDNNTTVVINPGTVTNLSHEGFVVGSTSIFVVNYVAFTNGTETDFLIDSANALTAQCLVTCSGDAGGGFTIIVRGFFTPRT